MSNTTQASVVSSVEHVGTFDEAATNQAAIDRATSVFTDVADHRSYYHDATVAEHDPDPTVVSLAPTPGVSAFGPDDSEVDFDRANRLENLVIVCAEHHHLWERASPLRLDTR